MAGLQEWMKYIPNWQAHLSHSENSTGKAQKAPFAR